MKGIKILTKTEILNRDFERLLAALAPEASEDSIIVHCAIAAKFVKQANEDNEVKDYFASSENAEKLIKLFIALSDDPKQPGPDYDLLLGVTTLVGASGSGRTARQESMAQAHNGALFPRLLQLHQQHREANKQGAAIIQAIYNNSSRSSKNLLKLFELGFLEPLLRYSIENLPETLLDGDDAQGHTRSAVMAAASASAILSLFQPIEYRDWKDMTNPPDPSKISDDTRNKILEALRKYHELMVNNDPTKINVVYLIQLVGFFSAATLLPGQANHDLKMKWLVQCAGEKRGEKALSLPQLYQTILDLQRAVPTQDQLQITFLKIVSNAHHRIKKAASDPTTKSSAEKMLAFKKKVCASSASSAGELAVVTRLSNTAELFLTLENLVKQVCSSEGCQEKENLRKCPCYLVQYCSPGCQSKDWPVHGSKVYHQGSNSGGSCSTQVTRRG